MFTWCYNQLQNYLKNQINTNKKTGLVKLVGQENSCKFRFAVSELVVGSDEQDNSCQMVGKLN